MKVKVKLTEKYTKIVEIDVEDGEDAWEKADLLMNEGEISWPSDDKESGYDCDIEVLG